MHNNEFSYFPSQEAKQIAFLAELNPSADPKKYKYLMKKIKQCLYNIHTKVV